MAKTKKETVKIGEGAIYDASVLGKPKMMILGVQHMFAMFGATVLVPALTGLSVSATLLFAGLGTLLFHLITKGKVPAFLGSSFAFLGGYFAISGLAGTEGYETMTSTDLLPYACFGVACAGLVYFVIAGLIKAFGVGKVMKFFPPIVTGPIIIAIGLTLSSSAIANASANWFVAISAIVIVVACNIWGKGMVKIIPIMLGVIGSSALGAAIHWATDIDVLEPAKIQAVIDASWIGLPFEFSNTAISIFTSGNLDTSLLITAIICIVPISLATVVEHIGDVCAISSTVNKNFLKEPGLHRTMIGDGIATILASLFGAPANTTYGENTGVLSLSKVYDPKVVRIAAILASVFAFCPKFAALVSLMPTATIGGVSLVLYGMISAVGVRNIVENKVDFAKSRNIIVAAIILVLAIGINYSTDSAIIVNLGSISISFSGLAVAAVVGIVLNAILPEKDYVFDDSEVAA